jgi:meiotically up-regulated gene 157 (Mug157) protein
VLLAAVLIAQTLIVPLTGERTRAIETASLFHTLFHDFFPEDDGTTYVQTGDIPAMWLRDSSAQTIPYIRFAVEYPFLRRRFAGVIRRDMRAINDDPYANAFQATYHVWERKWEVDSLAWPVLLLEVYLLQTRNRGVLTPNVHAALARIVSTYRCQEQHWSCKAYAYPYRVYTDDYYNPGTGMIWCAFRPSDDPVQYRFNIPQEMIAVVALDDIAWIASEDYHDAKLASEARSLGARVYTGIVRYGLFFDKRRNTWMYAYETDGYGHYNLMDDANIPNLTTMPYFDWSSAFDPRYLATRAFTLSMDNPWYFSGRYAEGLGSPHTPYGFVWPLGIIGRALTSTDLGEVMTAITTLAETDSETGLIHESFYPGGYWRFTRPEFGWANALYAELLFRSLAGFPSAPFMPDGPVVPFETRTQTPRIVPRLAQLENTANLVGTLGRLLEEGRAAASQAP